MKTVPVYEAKNRISELIACVELGEEVCITRRGVPVARLVAATPSTGTPVEKRDATANALQRLREIRKTLTLGEDLKSVARKGLD